MKHININLVFYDRKKSKLTDSFYSEAIELLSDKKRSIEQYTSVGGTAPEATRKDIATIRKLIDCHFECEWYKNKSSDTIKKLTLLRTSLCPRHQLLIRFEPYFCINLVFQLQVWELISKSQIRSFSYSMASEKGDLEMFIKVELRVFFPTLTTKINYDEGPRQNSNCD